MKVLALLPFVSLCHGFSTTPLPQQQQQIKSSSTTTALNVEIQENDNEQTSRRQFATSAALGLMGVATAAFVGGSPEEALASGGATAGKYT